MAPVLEDPEAQPLMGTPVVAEANKAAREWRHKWYNWLGDGSAQDVAACCLSWHAPFVAFGWNSSRGLQMSWWREALKFLLLTAGVLALLRGAACLVMMRACGPAPDAPMPFDGPGQLAGGAADPFSQDHPLPATMMGSGSGNNMMGLGNGNNMMGPGNGNNMMGPGNGNDMMGPGNGNMMDGLPRHLREDGEEQDAKPEQDDDVPATKPEQDDDVPEKPEQDDDEDDVPEHDDKPHKPEHGDRHGRPEHDDDDKPHKPEHGDRHGRPEHDDEDEDDKPEHDDDDDDDEDDEDWEWERARFGPGMMGNRPFHGGMHMMMADPECMERVMPSMAALALVSAAAVGLALYIAARRRTAVRERFGIEGSRCQDCALWTFCSPCALAQETRTMMHNNVLEGLWHGPHPATQGPYVVPAHQEVA